jgi:hypothetical protein
MLSLERLSENGTNSAFRIGARIEACNTKAAVAFQVRAMVRPPLVAYDFSE